MVLHDWNLANRLVAEDPDGYITAGRNLCVSSKKRPRGEQTSVLGTLLVIKQSPNCAEHSLIIQFNVTKTRGNQKG